MLSSDRPSTLSLNAPGDHGFCRMQRASARRPPRTDEPPFHHPDLPRIPVPVRHRHGRLSLRAVPAGCARDGAGPEPERDRTTDRFAGDPGQARGAARSAQGFAAGRTGGEIRPGAGGARHPPADPAVLTPGRFGAGGPDDRRGGVECSAGHALAAAAGAGSGAAGDMGLAVRRTGPGRGGRTCRPAGRDAPAAPAPVGPGGTAVPFRHRQGSAAARPCADGSGPDRRLRRGRFRRAGADRPARHGAAAGHCLPQRQPVRAGRGPGDAGAAVAALHQPAAGPDER